jgi:2-keto-myo-inositol isomerase
MTEPCSFALNHMAAPRKQFPEFAALARSLGITDVEIRNDLAGVAIADGTAAEHVRQQAVSAGVSIVSINALQRFNTWDEEREAEAVALATYAAGCGAKALVLCPVNSWDDRRDATRRQADLRYALERLAPILSRAGLLGLVEPLGFAESSLRFKRDVVAAIDAVGAGQTFALVHDTFHHFLSSETEFFPERTGLVHISGVEDRILAHAEIRDGHRVLVGEADILGNIEQIRALLRGGYRGLFSFEPFAESIQADENITDALNESIALVRARALS